MNTFFYARPKRPIRSFSLVELMVVIAILGMLASVVTVSVMSHMEDARYTAAKTDMKAIGDAAQLYKVNTGRWPQSLDDLMQDNYNLGRKWKGPYLGNKPVDPWDGEYQFSPPSGRGADYEIISYGADGSQGGAEGTEEADLVWSEIMNSGGN